LADIIVSVVVIIASLFFFRETLSYPTKVGFEKMGAGFWPGLILIGMVIVAVIIIIKSALERNKRATSSSASVKTGFFIIVGGLVVYQLLIPILGFFPASFIAMVGFITILGEKNKLLIFCSSLGLVAAIWVVFVKVMITPLPRGVSIFKEFSYLLH
jgi:hypothetical protein